MDDSLLTRLFLHLGLARETAWFAATIVHAAIVVHFFAVCPIIFIWLERKVSGRIQDRLGPTRVGGKFGWLQSVADGIKLVQKEDLCPSTADAWLFKIAPFIVFTGSFAAFIALPWSDGWSPLELDAGLFFILAVMSIEVVGVIFGGYASGSKWSLFGGMREAAQVVSYEIPMALCAMVPVAVAGTLNVTDITRMQGGGFWNWFVLRDPFCFIAFFVYFIVATAGVKRAPFDLAEAESELVAGFHTEYSGIRWSYFFMAEYASMFAVSGLAALLFLGGWHSGLAIGADTLPPEGVWGWLWSAAGMGVFVAKASGLVFVQMWVRWTLPRLRIDQVLTTCLKYLLPIGCVLLVGASAWPLVVYQASAAIHGGPGRTVLYGPALGESRAEGLSRDKSER